MKLRIPLLGGFGALLAFAAPARAETIDPVSFSRTISFKAAGYDGASTLEHFPVLVRLSEGIAGFSYADIGGTTNAAYASLRFTDADRANLDYEIEEWNPAGTSFVWVSLPELSGTNTEFHAFYAPVPSAVLPAVHPTNVWTSAGYVGVWHMNSRIGKNSAATYPDATGTAIATHSDASNWQGDIRDAGNSTTANGTKWMVQNPPLVVSNDFTQAWTFSQTGCSLEAWRSAQSGNTWTPYFTDGANNAYAFCVGVRGDSTGQGGGVWFNGQSTVRVYPGDSASNTWHFITAVCPAAGSSGDSVLYGEDGSVEDEITELVTAPASKVAAVDYTQNGMGLTTVIGGRSSGTWCDELRVRRGVSTRDWVQANYDVQRAGTDFVEYGAAVGDPRAPIVSAVAGTSATAVLEFSLADHGGATAKALFVAFPSFATNAVAVANLARPSARATGLSPDTDYTVTFVVENGGAVVYETPSTAFTTAGRPTLRPNAYRHSVTFTASGYDGTETLGHFPVLVRLSEAAVPGFSYTGVDPATIRFTAADGALLAHEVETWDPAGLSAIWVALPELSGKDTSFTMHWSPYDGAGVPAQPVFRVWKYAGYVGVWHVNARVQIDGSWCFADSSGGNATLVGQTGNVAEALTNASYNANGTPWTAANANNRARTTFTSGWTFSRTGYSVESWISTRDLPGYNNGNARNGYMFASDALTDNGAEKQWSPSNGLQIYPTYATMLGGNTGASVETQNPAWPGDATNDWHFITAVWPQDSSTDLATLYEAGAGYSSHGTNLRVLRTINRRAIDFTGPRGMGVFGSSDFQGNGSYYDEARVRRGLSSKDWIQANWDTQRLGTDFLAAGTVVDNLLPTVIVVR